MRPLSCTPSLGCRSVRKGLARSPLCNQLLASGDSTKSGWLQILEFVLHCFLVSCAQVTMGFESLFVGSHSRAIVSSSEQ